MKNLCIPTILLFFFFSNLNAQSPPELFSSIPYDSDPTTVNNQINRVDVADIAAAFNNGRRNEENQFSLFPNTIANITMPTQAVWDSYSSAEKILHLINEERTARAGVNYLNGVGPVKGLPLTGIEQNITNIAQSLAATFSITGYTNIVDMNPPLGGNGCMNNDSPPVNCCHELLSPNQLTSGANSLISPVRAYQITFDTANGIPFPGIEVRAIYDFVYRFQNRLTILIQDEDLNPTTSSQFGMDDNYGAFGDEGFLGVGLFNGPSPRGLGMDSTYLVVSLFDPVPQIEGCNYNCTSCGTCPATLTENSNPIPSDVYQADNWVRSAGTVQSSTVVDMHANVFVELLSNFEVDQGATYHAFISDCFFTMN